ncbi:hypothetical protein JKF63_05337 [Porcisia hertigi]|uniref:Uncharacterized protein n=1 Tax=Porcisia hertigi TaxID=2761500 RepID=A0A836LGW3_9TRYP|nr:hypothetical protein JKF63_05337 [Porcisia hertigi]
MGCQMSAVRNRVVPPDKAAPPPKATSSPDTKTNMQNYDPSTPSPPLSSEMLGQSDVALTRRAFADRAQRADRCGVDSAATQMSTTQPENHFDPLPMPTVVQRQGQPAVRMVGSGGRKATFRIKIEGHEKTDSAQAAKEYQQHLQARRSAEAAHSKRRQLEEFDPVRPVDNFNVTHRGLLGRCWDRRAPELIPVSFVCAIEEALGVAEGKQPSCTTFSYPPGTASGLDAHTPASPHVFQSRLNHAGGYLPASPRGRNQSQAMPQSPRGPGPGQCRILRRSHWFSVGGVSCEAMHRPLGSRVSSTNTVWPGTHGSGFPRSASSPALSRAGAIPIRGGAKSSTATPAPSPVLYSSGINTTVKRSPIDGRTLNPGNGGAQLREPLTLEQISSLPMEEREHYLNDLLTGNPRFMGIKNRFAFRLADGVSEDSSTKFLRKLNLEPAPGVQAVRWNRVEFFNPTLRTLIRAVNMTQSKPLSTSPLARPQRRNSTSVRGHPHLQNKTGDGDGGEVNSIVGASTGMVSGYSFSQCVMLQMENRSFSGGGGGTHRTLSSYPDKQRGIGDTSAAYNNSFSSPLRYHHSQPDKDPSTESGLQSDGFPEDSVLSLALCIPASHLPRLSGVPPMFQLDGIGSPWSRLAPPAAARTPRGGAGSWAAPQSPLGTPPGTSTHVWPDGNVLVALSVNSFSVSIDPFHWEENRYIRHPVDVDSSKKSSRQTYGEGFVTSVMYGGVMVVEGSSVAAVEELQALLTSMTWTEGRSLQGAMGDVHKHLKLSQGIRTKAPQPSSDGGTYAPHGPGARQQQAGAEKDHQYRIWRRIGGRPMRDAVELQEISYFFDDAMVREETATLNRPVESDAANAAIVADPDISPSFSRVASVWVKLPVIAAVLRTWGLHLLSNPEFAQPIAMFLQKYAGIAPALQFTALSSIYHEGNTPNEKTDNDDDDIAYHFFEGDGANVTVPNATVTAPDDATHPQPTPRIPRFNRFYTSMPATPSCMEDITHTVPSSTDERLQSVSQSPALIHRSSETVIGLRNASDADTQQRLSEGSGLYVFHGMGPKRHSQETLEGEAVRLSESANSWWTAPGVEHGRDENQDAKDDGPRLKHTDVRESLCGSKFDKVNPNRVATPHSTDARPGGPYDFWETPGWSTPFQPSHDALGKEPGRLSMKQSASTLLESKAAAKRGINDDLRGNPISAISSLSTTPRLQGSILPHSASLRRPIEFLGTPPPSSPAEMSKTAPATAAMSVAPPLRAKAAAAAAAASGKRTNLAASGRVSKEALHSQRSLTEPKNRFNRPKSETDMDTETTPPLCPRRTTARPSAVLEAAAAAAAAASSTRRAVLGNHMALPSSQKEAQSAARITTFATPATTTTAQRKRSAAAAVTIAPTQKRSAKATLRGRSANGTQKTPAPVDRAQTFFTKPAACVEIARTALPLPSATPPSVEIQGTNLETSRANPVAVNEEEALWHMAMLEVKAQRQELKDLRQACHAAEDAAKQRQDELRLLNRTLLPQTTPQELDSALMYLKTALYDPEDLPHGRLFLQQPNWLPMLAAVWTAPANCIRTVEIAADLTWVDIPRLGVMAGMLYRQHASGPLEELIIRADKLLGFPRESARSRQNTARDGDLVDNTVVWHKKPHLLTGLSKKWKREKKKSYSPGANQSNRCLNFTTELDQRARVFGAGCPPFLITPEEARDTLWLLLCSVAANTTAPTFRVVLRGLPTGEVDLASGGSGAGRTRTYGKDRRPSTRFASLLAGAAARPHDEHANAPLSLKPDLMGLESFIVSPGLPLKRDQVVRSPMRQLQSTGVDTNLTRDNTLEEQQLCHISNSIQLHADGTGENSLTSSPPICTVSQQNSFLLIMSSPNASVVGSGGAQELHNIGKAQKDGVDSSGPPRCTPNKTCAAASAMNVVQTHLHRAHCHHAWMSNGNGIERRPFYELLMHRSGAAVGTGAPAQISAAVATSKPTQRAIARKSPTDSHPNTTHKSGSFYAEPHHEQRQRETRGHLAANAVATRSGKPPDTATDEATSEAPSQLPQTSFCPSSSAHFLCDDAVPGLRTPADEEAALLSGVVALRERAGDIWEVLRKSVKHHNEHQLSKYQKAMKKGLDSQSLSPPRQIVLEY